jgi:putative hemolysin
LTGCASVPLRDGGASAATLWQMARQRHLPPPAWRVRPRRPWPVDTFPSDGERANVSDIPPLLRGYLRLGAWVCGPPAYDPDFEAADFLVLLAMDRVDPRYLRRFLDGMPG